MDFFETLDKISEAITNNSKNITQKATEYAEVTKLYSKISGANSKINKLLISLGRAYYNEYKDSEEDAFKGILDEIKAEGRLIEECQNQIRQIKHVKICIKCGTETGEEAMFCPKCGTRLPDIEPKAEDADIEPEEDIIEEEEGAMGPDVQDMTDTEGTENLDSNEKMTESQDIPKE